MLICGRIIKNSGIEKVIGRNIDGEIIEYVVSEL